VHQGDVSVYVEDVDLIFPRQNYNYKEHERKNDKNGRKLLLDALEFVGISRRDRISNYLGIFQLGPD
jgi:hypothetical protein